MRRLTAALVLLAGLLAAPASAQSVYGDRFILNTGPCTTRSGSGSPEGAVTGRVCDRYIRTDASTTNPTVYVKNSGTGNTGWVPMPSYSPSSAGTFLRADGSVWAASTATLPNTATSGQVLHATATNVWGGSTGLLYSGSTFTVNNTITTPSATSLTVSPTGDVLFNPTGNDLLPTTNYDINLGSLQAKYLTLHAAELWVETLVAQNTIATIGGRVLVAPTTTLTADLAAAGTTITVKHNEMVSGDRVYMEADGKVEFMAITSGAGGSAGAYTYSVTRNLDGSGANDWFAGDAMLNTGTTGDGFIDLYSVGGVLSGSGPTIVGNVRTGTTYNNIEPRWAIGNLNGLYGYGATTYGAAFGSPSAAWIKIDPTNGVRIGHNSTTYTQIDASGNASFTGAITAASGTIGGWSIGATALTGSSGTVGMSSAVTGGDDIRFWAGDATPASAEFSVTEAGVLTATSGTVGLFTLAAGGLEGTALTLHAAGFVRVGGGDSNEINMSSVDASYRLWVGDSTASAAEFAVTNTGAMVAPSWTIRVAGANDGVIAYNLIQLGAQPLGTGNVPGPRVEVGRNSSGSGAAATLLLYSRNGTPYYLWVSDAGGVYVSTAPPEEDNSPSETSGTPLH